MKDKGVQTLESMSQAVWYNRWTLGKFKEYLKGEILEVGCGIGNFTKTLTDFGQVWAMDIEKDYVNGTKKAVARKAKVGFGDIERGKYFFGEKIFDCVICINVLEHVEKDLDALNNLYNLLKTNGFLILLVPAHNFLYSKIDKSIGHFRRYDKRHLNNLLIQTGFRIHKQRRINMLGAIGWWFSSKLLSKNTVEENQVKLFNLIAPIFLPLEDLLEPSFGTSILVIARKKDE